MSAAHVRASHDLAERDAVIAALLDRHGPMVIGRPSPVRRRFESLVRTISHQQLAGRAAATIWSRVRALIDGEFSAEAVAGLDPSLLRGAGLSGSKVASVLDLTAQVLGGGLRLEGLGRRKDDEVVDLLTGVRGIGTWSAQMFLMHELGRLDVWPTGDLGVRKGFALAHRMTSAPTPHELMELGERFRPYRSVVAWYCWRCADDPEFVTQRAGRR